MKSIHFRSALIATPLFVLFLSGCGSIESAAQTDCTSIGWQIGSPGYNQCFKARVYERKLDYSLPPGDQPAPSLL